MRSHIASTNRPLKVSRGARIWQSIQSKLGSDMVCVYVSRTVAKLVVSCLSVAHTTMVCNTHRITVSIGRDSHCSGWRQSSKLCIDSTH